MSEGLISFLLKHCLAGILAGWTVVGLLLITDLGRLGTLVLGAEQPWLPLGMLLAGFAVTFGSVAMGAAIMSLGRPEPPARGRLLGEQGPRGRLVYNRAANR
jgi:hypothetical protein